MRECLITSPALTPVRTGAAEGRLATEGVVAGRQPRPPTPGRRRVGRRCKEWGVATTTVVVVLVTVGAPRTQRLGPGVGRPTAQPSRYGSPPLCVRGWVRGWVEVDTRDRKGPGRENTGTPGEVHPSAGRAGKGTSRNSDPETGCRSEESYQGNCVRGPTGVPVSVAPITGVRRTDGPVVL